MPRRIKRKYVRRTVPVLNDTLIVIATNNGMDYLPKLLDSMPVGYKWLVVDTGSTDVKFIEYLKTLGDNVTKCNGGWCLGAYVHAIEHYKADSYFFMHDSMVIKDKNFLNKFNMYDFCGWLYFHTFFDSPYQESYVKALYGENLPPFGVFGPIFYAKRDIIAKIEIPVPTNIEQAHGMERGIASAIFNAGLNLNFIDEYDPQKLEADTYETFTKLRPKRD